MSDTATAPWLQLTLETLEHGPEQLEDALLQAGAMAVTLQDAGDQPVLEPPPGATPLWSHALVTGLFDAQTDIESVKQHLRRILGCDPLPECQISRLEDRNWVQAWLDDYHPMRFGERLRVIPGGQPSPDPGAVTVLLDPGLAFGTGTHPTTALCLEWLDGAVLEGKTVIDYGCGSGILAIAAAKLGAVQVHAVDIDPQALLASRQNAVNNGVSDKIQLSIPNRLAAPRADILLANILAGPLIGLAARFSHLLGGGAELVLSGILEQQAQNVQAAFEPWFDFKGPRQREDWMLLHAVRPG